MGISRFPAWTGGKYLDFSVSMKAVLAEFVAMTIFVFVGCGTAVFFSRIVDGTFTTEESSGESQGTATGLGGKDKAIIVTLQTNGNWGITTAMAFGMAIMYLVYTFGHISGGHINCAVTLGLVLAGHCGPLQGICNFIAQMIGSILGAGFLFAIVPGATANSSLSLGQNAVNTGGGFTSGQAFLGEAFMTFVLVFVVLMTVTDPRSISGHMAPFAIGMVVFSAHAVLLPIDGCSINPTRSFGPAVVAGSFNNYWVFWIGPLTGAIFAVPFYFIFRQPKDTVKNTTEEATAPESMEPKSSNHPLKDGTTDSAAATMSV
jgi:MIP family channel proteins